MNKTTTPNYCQYCGSNLKEKILNVDYDDLFDDLECDLMAYFKNEKMLNKYVKLKTEEQSFIMSKHDILWSIYNDIKMKYELTDQYNALASVLYKMADLLCIEKKYSQALQFAYATLYCKYLTSAKHNLPIPVGRTLTREILKLLERTKQKHKYDEYVICIHELIPQTYNETYAKSIYNEFIKEVNKIT